jgi:glycine/D-amino acid oxidase-like deaminating enzyme
VVPSVIVIGAGVLGSAVAHELARHGAGVTVLDAGRPGGGTSSSSFSWVNAQDKSPAHYFELNAAGVAAYPELATTLGGDWYHAGGDLAIGRGPTIATLRERIDRHAALGYPVRVLDRAAIAALEPNLDLGSDEVLGAHFEADAWVDARDLVGRLLAAARAHGARVLAGSRVGEIDAHGGRVRRIRLESGDSLRTETLLIAAGAASEDLARLAGIVLPMAPSPGLLGLTAPIEAGVSRVVHAGDIAIRPAGGGRLLLASRAVDSALSAETRDVPVDADPSRELLARAARHLPGLQATARLESARVGVRSVAVDGQPAVGFVPGIENAYVLVSHSGVTLAPVLGRLVAAELLGATEPLLDPYRPARFAGASRAGAAATPGASGA